MKYKICFGSGVTVFPEKAAERIIGGKASLREIKVLTALLSLEEDKRSPEAVAVMISVTETEAENALNFWRGAGIIEEIDTEDGADEAVSVPDEEKVSPEEEEKTGKKALSGDEMPKYSGEDISAMLGKDGGKLKSMIDECQQILGKIFGSPEIETMVGLCDWLGLEPEYVVTLCGYYSRKKPGIKVKYIEKAAVGLYNEGICSTEQLEEYVKNMEIFDGAAGKLRLWLGAGPRDFTTRESGYIKRWVNDFGFGEDVIRKAYEITVDNVGQFKFPYAGQILESWFKSGVKTVEDADKCIKEYKASGAFPGIGATKGQASAGGSFGTSEFFEAALKRSYDNIGK